MTDADLGTALAVQVTAAQAGNANTGVAVSESVFVKASSKTSVKMNTYVGKTSTDFAVTVLVTPSGGAAAATGPVTVWVNAQKYTGELDGGSVTIPLKKQKRGVYVVAAAYPGSDQIDASAGVSGFVVLR